MKLSIKELLENDNTHINQSLNIYGFVRTLRKQTDLYFCAINDGSTPKCLQIIMEKNKENLIDFEQVDVECKIGASVKIYGKIVSSPAKGQNIEMKAIKFTTIGTVDEDYPISKTKMSMEYLRRFPHLRVRTNSMGCIMRIRNTILYESHNFFQKLGYLLLDPNIITVNECEGGASAFYVTEKSENTLDWKTDHFEKKVCLTVSSQLQLEALACSLGNVYTMNKSFRGEHSCTTKHLSEFSHLEIESIHVTQNDLMNLVETYIKNTISVVMEKNDDDLDTLNMFLSKGISDNIAKITESKFIRVKYEDAVIILGKSIKYGEDINSECEHKLIAHFNNTPIFVTDWPIDIKSFYMKNNEDGTTCQSFDLLVPGIGELVGGSMREENKDILLKKMKNNGISEESLQFYVDIRKYGTVPHGGFGLGIDRLVMLLTGIKNIKDVVPFPVYYKHCQY
jgi:asparaginyl-tRNA synthetase